MQERMLKSSKALTDCLGPQTHPEPSQASVFPSARSAALIARDAETCGVTCGRVSVLQTGVTPLSAHALLCTVCTVPSLPPPGLLVTSKTET